MKNRISSFSTVFILSGFLYILFLLYSIGSSVWSVQQTEFLIVKKEQEVKMLEKKRNERLQSKYIMLSPQYQDRIAKETLHTLSTGEKEFILPIETAMTLEETNPYAKSAEQLQKEKSIPEQWNDVFFRN